MVNRCDMRVHVNISRLFADATAWGRTRLLAPLRMWIMIPFVLFWHTLINQRCTENVDVFQSVIELIPTHKPIGWLISFTSLEI